MKFQPQNRLTPWILTWAVALCLTWAGPSAAAAVGDAFPTLQLTDVQTGNVKEVGEVLKGSAGALVYMQTSCAACRKELTALKDLLPKFPKFKVVVISVDSGTPERVVRYREHFGFDFPFFQDPDFKTPELFGFSFTPAIVLVDKEGKIAFLKGGFRPGDEVELEKKIASLMGK